MSGETLPQVPGVPPGSYRVLQSVEARLSEEDLADLKRRIGRALEYFPALTGQTVTVACRRRPESDHSRWNPYAQADPVNRLIRVPTHERCSNVTIFHELAHIAIRVEDESGEDHPVTSEEYCSLYAIARQPPELLDEDEIPYLGSPEAPKERWPEIARKSLEYRKNHHAYIQQARALLGSDGGQS